MTVCASPTTVDVRKLTPRDRYPVASAAFGLLRAGDTLELANDQDLKAVKVQFDSNLPGKFAWAWLEQGPTLWRAAVTPVKSGHSNGGCCGGCGGA